MPLPTDSRLDVMARELARLEHVNRRWRRSTLFALMALAGVGVMGQIAPPSRTLEVTQLTIRDTSGRRRVTLGTLEDDAVVLTFRDRLERDRLAIGLVSDGSPLVSFFDGHRRRRAALGVLDGDAPGLSLYGEDGISRARLELAAGSPRLVGASSDGTVLWEVPPSGTRP